MANIEIGKTNAGSYSLRVGKISLMTSGSLSHNWSGVLDNYSSTVEKSGIWITGLCVANSEQEYYLDCCCRTDRVWSLDKTAGQY